MHSQAMGYNNGISQSGAGGCSPSSGQRHSACSGACRSAKDVHHSLTALTFGIEANCVNDGFWLELQQPMVQYGGENRGRKPRIDHACSLVSATRDWRAEVVKGANDGRRYDDSMILRFDTCNQPTERGGYSSFLLSAAGRLPWRLSRCWIWSLTTEGRKYSRLYTILQSQPTW